MGRADGEEISGTDLVSFRQSDGETLGDLLDEILGHDNLSCGVREHRKMHPRTDSVNGR